MRNMVKSILSLILIGLCSLSFGQGIEFYHGSFDEALEQAKMENKLVFVDAFTTWCGPCKRLSANVFPKAEVGEYYNNNFICVKLDMDKKENHDFAKTYMVTAYPTLLYIDGEGKLVHKALGGRDVEGFIKEGQKAYISNPGILDKYNEQFANGDRDPVFLRDYIITLSRSGNKFDEPLSEYLGTQSIADMVSDENTNLVFQTAQTIHSPTTPFLIEDKELYVTKFGVEKYDHKLNSIADQSISNAAKDTNAQLFEESIDFLKKNKPEGFKNSISTGTMNYASKVGDWDTYSKTAKKHFKKYADPEDHVAMRNVALVLVQCEVEEYLDEAEGFINDALSIKDNYENNLIKSLILYRKGALVDAKALAEYSITRANKESKFAGEAMNLVNEINQALLNAEENTGE